MRGLDLSAVFGLLTVFALLDVWPDRIYLDIFSGFAVFGIAGIFLVDSRFDD